MNFITVLILTILLVALNAYFVTTEFALLRIRKTRLQKLFDSNAWGSDSLKTIMKNLNLYVVTSQIGISLTTLLMGFITLTYTQSEISDYVMEVISSPIISILISVIFAILVVSFIHSVFGEIVPKIVVAENIEQMALRLAPALYWITIAMTPLSWLYRESSKIILKILRISSETEVYSRVYSEDELKLIVAKSQQEGEIDESEEFLINKVLDFTDTRVNEIFTPRYEIVAFDINTPVEQIIEKAKETGYSRFPVFEGKLDQIDGFVHVKDILVADFEDPSFSLREVLRPVFIIHEAMRLDLLLKKMQQDRSQVAIVVDEYGSVEGLVTIEDILEAIVGPIDDEFDIGSVELVKKTGRNRFTVDGRVTLDVFNQAFQCQLEAKDSVTIAGFILEHLENVPEEGSRLTHSGKYADFEFIVIKMDGNRVDRAQVIMNRKATKSDYEDEGSLTPQVKPNESIKTEDEEKSETDQE